MSTSDTMVDALLLMRDILMLLGRSADFRRRHGGVFNRRLCRRSPAPRGLSADARR